MRRHRSQQMTCSKCLTAPKRPGNRWCHACHAADEAARRVRRRAELEALRAAVAHMR
jgi:hypothetical protein